MAIDPSKTNPKFDGAKKTTNTNWESTETTVGNADFGTGDKRPTEWHNNKCICAHCKRTGNRNWQPGPPEYPPEESLSEQPPPEE